VDVASSTVPPIGARLRAARRRRGLSVRGLAREVGVSASLISQIETEKSSPSVSTLYAITTALEISIEDLFGAAPAETDDDPEEEPDTDDLGGEPADVTPSPAADGRALSGHLLRSLALDGLGQKRPPGSDRRVGPVVTPDGREILALDSGVTWELLGKIPGTHVDFLLITYQPGGTSSSSGLLMRHSGTEFGYVIRGELTLTLGFDPHRLRAGDAVSFDSTTPHAYRNESPEPAVGVWFVLERST
jgi:transcriptional regulator with XRE-family HTH domain/quercetin dioxygenase-like cupin family protein